VFVGYADTANPHPTPLLKLTTSLQSTLVSTARPAGRAAQVRADIAPIPRRQISKVKPAIVLAPLMLAGFSGPKQRTMMVLNPALRFTGPVQYSR
jgi:hypothetical protein